MKMNLVRYYVTEVIVGAVCAVAGAMVGALIGVLVGAFALGVVSLFFRLSIWGFAGPGFSLTTVAWFLATPAAVIAVFGAVGAVCEWGGWS